MKKTSIGLVMLLAIVLVAWSYTKWQANIAPSQGRDSQQSGEHTTPHDVKSKERAVPMCRSSDNQESDQPLTLESATRLFGNANSAGQAISIINDARNSGLNQFANWAEIVVSRNCGTLDGLVNSGRMTTDWARKAAVSYCADWESSYLTLTAEETHQFDSQNTASRYQTRAVLKQLSIGERGEFVKEAVLTARNPFDVTHAFALISELSESDQQFADLGQDKNLNFHDYAQSLSLAGILANCRLFGGCAPNQASVLIMCAHFGACQPGWNMESLIYNSASPVQYEQARKILDFIFQRPN